MAALPTTIATGMHAADPEITDLQKAVQALLAQYGSGILLPTSGGTGLGAYAKGDLLYAPSSNTLARLAAPSDGTYSLKFASSVPSYVAAAAGGGGWTVAYSLDFTAQPTQNLITGGDGAKTIAGVTWYVSGTAGSTTFGITNGTGLVMLRNSADPAIYVPIANLVSSYAAFHTDVEVWARIIPANITTSASWAASGFIKLSGTANDGNNWLMWSGRRFGLDKSPNAHWLTLAHFAGSDISFASTPVTSNNLTDDVAVSRLLASNLGDFYSGAYSAGFPSFSALTKRGAVQTHSIPQASQSAIPGPAEVAWVATASGNTTQITITHLQVLTRG